MPWRTKKPKRQFGDDKKGGEMSNPPENTKPEEENKNHTYVTNRIPWFVHAILDHFLDHGDRVCFDVSISRDPHGIPQPAMTMSNADVAVCAYCGLPARAPGGAATLRMARATAATAADSPPMCPRPMATAPNRTGCSRGSAWRSSAR